MKKTDAETAMREMTMMLMYLARFTRRNDDCFDENSLYAWKGYDFEVLDALDEKDFIRKGSHRSKSVYLTKIGVAKAKELMEKYGIEDWEV